METNNRYNRQRYADDFRERQSHHLQRVDPDSYRGAYRFDTDSDRTNEVSYDGFDLNDSMAHHTSPHNYSASHYREPDSYKEEKNQGGDYVYRRSRNTQDNNHRYNDNFRREQERPDQHYSENYNRGNYTSRGGSGYSNFNNNYGPDPYHNRHRHENYGNMAGSLSFGYDGDYNSDPDERRRYDPQSGRIRRNINEVDRSRNPDHYGPPDNFGMNPDYDRY